MCYFSTTVLNQQLTRIAASFYHCKGRCPYYSIQKANYLAHIRTRHRKYVSCSIKLCLLLILLIMFIPRESEAGHGSMDQCASDCGGSPTMPTPSADLMDDTIFSSTREYFVNAPLASDPSARVATEDTPTPRIPPPQGNLGVSSSLPVAQASVGQPGGRYDLTYVPAGYERLPSAEGFVSQDGLMSPRNAPFSVPEAPEPISGPHDIDTSYGYGEHSQVHLGQSAAMGATSTHHRLPVLPPHATGFFDSLGGYPTAIQPSLVPTLHGMEYQRFYLPGTVPDFYRPQNTYQNLYSTTDDESLGFYYSVPESQTEWQELQNLHQALACLDL